MASVKGKRSYDSSRRRERARLTREAVLDTAQRLFLEEGYAATTITSIAGDAGVSVETIYKAFGGKPGLVKEIPESTARRLRPTHSHGRRRTSTDDRLE